MPATNLPSTPRGDASRPAGPSLRPLVWLGVVIAILMAVAVGAYHSYALSVQASTEALLQSIARARATAIRAHLDERIADAWVLSRRDRLVRMFPANGASPTDQQRRELEEAMADMSSAYGYHNIVVLDRNLNALVSQHEDSLDAREVAALRTTMQTGRPQPILLHSSPEGTTEYGLVAPIRLSEDSTTPPDGALYLVLDVESRLVPLLGGGVPSESFRNLLMQVGTDSTIAVAGRVGDMREISPLIRVGNARAEALRRSDNALDFDGVPVLRGIAPVPYSPWVLVAKIDREEAEAPVRVAATVIAVAFLLLLALMVLIARNVGRRQQQRALIEKDQLALRTLRVVETSTDGYLVLDEQGRILDANDALLSIVGYDRRTLLSLSIGALKITDASDEVAATLQRIRSGINERYVSRWRHRDGHEIDVDVSATYLEEEGGGRIYAFVRDITDSLASRRRLERVNRLYAYLNHAGEALFRTRDRDEAFAMVCRISVSEGGFPLAWVGVVNDAEQRVDIVVAHGEAAEYAQDLVITLDPALPTSRGPGGRCIAERRPVMVDDFTRDPSVAPWRDMAKRFGLRSSAALPVLVDGRPVAALMLYDTHEGAFDSELVSLLEEVSRLLALVLQGIEIERQRAEEQERRRRSEERFRTHFEALPIATYVVHEASGTVRRVNRAFINLFGYEAYDVPTLEASFERFFADPVYRAQTFEVFRRDLAEVTAGAKPRRSREYSIRCRDGDERVVQAIVTRTADELIIGWVDLTELRQSQVLLREAQRIARLGSWSYDFRSRTRELSEDAIELFDLDRTRGGTQGMMLAAFSRADLTFLEAQFFRAIRDRQVYEVTVPVTSRRGTRRYALIRARVKYDERGEPLRAVGSVQDVTEQTEAANELARYRDQLEQRVIERTAALATANEQLAGALEAADAASRAKSAFLAVMSHEIRTPLNGVIGMAEVLAQSPLPSRDAEAVRIIRGSATNLLGIIDDILDFSKIEAGRIDLERESTSVGEILDGVQASLAPMADARGVDVTLHIAPDVPERIVTDATRLRQICYNLVGNAIKFSGGRQHIRGRVAVRVDVDAHEPLRVRIAVIDNGIGMSADTMAHLFTSFTQAEISTTRRFGGTGLGLAICKRLTDLFGGEISVQSQPDVGSTFTVLLPTEEVAYTSPLPAIDVHGVPCVLLQEADALQEMDDMAIHLRHAGAVVTIVSTVSEALAVLQGAAKPAVFVRRAPNGTAPGVDGFDNDEVRALHITDGRRRTARVVAPSLVTLDRYYLRPRSLLRAVAIAAGRASPELLKEDLPALSAVTPRAAPISVEQARAEGQLILVAEDDEVNQKVIMQQLALLGFAAEIARNGAEALAMLQANRYALLLTDLHMPVMDGYELTRRIRSDEAATSAPYPLPIVALTANALRGEETRVRELGMTAFLTKPVLLNVLKGTLSQWVTPQVAAPTPKQAMPAIATAATGHLPTLDVSVLQGLVGDDADIIHEFLTDYRTSAQRIAGDIRLAQTQGDLSALGAACHKLKSSSRSVGALSLGELCQKIEQSARQRDVESVNRSTEEFELEFEAVMNALSSALS